MATAVWVPGPPDPKGWAFVESGIVLLRPFPLGPFRVPDGSFRCYRLTHRAAG